MEQVFWISFFLLGYTYLGYPVVLWLGTRVRKPAPSDCGEVGEMPSLSVVVVARDESKRIESRVRNLMECLPADSEAEILVVCNGCSDDTLQKVESLAGERVRVIDSPETRSKAAGLNRGVSEAKGEVIVFADARQSFDREAVRRLAGHFRNGRVGAVSGNLEIDSSENGAGQGLDLYWRLEKFIRHHEALIDSSVGCTGAVYAIRRDLYEPLPEDTLLDDVVIPMRIATRGYRVLFDPQALAYEPQQLDPAIEKRRKHRTLTGNFQMLFRYPAWLLPWKNRLWWQLISHKYLRLGGSFFILLCLLSSILLAPESSFYRAAWIGQGVCFAFAAVGLTFPAATSRLFTMPAGFLFLQWHCTRAFFSYLLSYLDRRRGREYQW